MANACASSMDLPQPTGYGSKKEDILFFLNLSGDCKAERCFHHLQSPAWSESCPWPSDTISWNCFYHATHFLFLCSVHILILSSDPSSFVSHHHPPTTTFSPYILQCTTATQHLGHVLPEQYSRCHTSDSVVLLSPFYPTKVPFLYYQLSKACRASKSNLNYPYLPSHPAGNLHQLWPLQSVY